MEETFLKKEEKTIQRRPDGTFAPGQGGPGRPPGVRNKHTLIIEQMAETFLDAKGKEAFQKTLLKDDGTLDLDALELLLKYNPALSKAFGDALGSTVNIIINNAATSPQTQIDVEVSDG
jgi:hypothetical protein